MTDFLVSVERNRFRDSFVDRFGKTPPNNTMVRRKIIVKSSPLLWSLSGSIRQIQNSSMCMATMAKKREIKSKRRRSTSKKTNFELFLSIKEKYDNRPLCCIEEQTVSSNLTPLLSCVCPLFRSPWWMQYGREREKTDRTKKKRKKKDISRRTALTELCR